MQGLKAFEKFKPRYVEYIEWLEEELKSMGIPCTGAQRGFIYGMCKKLGYNERCLPDYISPVSEPRDMDIGQAADAIDRLLSEVLFLEEDYYMKWGENKRYGKRATQRDIELGRI